MDNDQEIAIFRSYVEHHPEFSEMTAGHILLLSLEESFPCH